MQDIPLFLVYDVLASKSLILGGFEVRICFLVSLHVLPEGVMTYP